MKCTKEEYAHKVNSSKYKNTINCKRKNRLYRLPHPLNQAHISFSYFLIVPKCAIVAMKDMSTICPKKYCIKKPPQRNEAKRDYNEKPKILGVWYRHNQEEFENIHEFVQRTLNSIDYAAF